MKDIPEIESLDHILGSSETNFSQNQDNSVLLIIFLLLINYIYEILIMQPPPLD